MSRKYVLILVFVFFAAGIALLFRFAAPQHSDRAMAQAFASIRDAQAFSGVATLVTASDAPAGGAPAQAAPAAMPLAMRAAFKFAMPSGATPGAGDVALTVFGIAPDGKDAYAEFRILPDGRTFARLDHMPFVSAPADPAAAPGEDGVTGSWWTFDRALLGEFLASGDLAAAAGAASGAEKTDAPGASEADAAAARWSKLREDIASGSLFVTNGRTAIETIDGVRAYRTDLGFRREAAESFLKDFRAALLGRELTAAETAEAALDADRSAASLAIWVDERSGALIQAQLDLDSRDGTMRSLLFKALDFATPVTVEAPPSPRPFAELLSRLRPAAMPAP